MPAGLSWTRYLAALSACVVSMAAGSALVHNFYQPLADLDEYVERELQSRKQTKSHT